MSSSPVFRIARVALVLCLALVGPIATARASTAGSLDPTFGTRGILATDVDSGAESRGRHVFVQPSGKVVVVWSTGADPYDLGARGAFGVTRYLPSGAIDPSFGADGTYVVGVDSSSAELDAAAMQPDGKIVFTGDGVTGFASGSLFIARLTVDGALDATLSGDGIASLERASPNDGASGLGSSSFTGLGLVSSIAFGPGGSIALAGTGFYSSYRNVVAVAKLHADGSPDTTFDHDGLQTFDFQGDNRDNVVTVQPNGQLVLGVSYTGKGFWLTRLAGDGMPDPTFGDDGIVSTQFGDPWDNSPTVKSLTVSGGSITASGMVVASRFPGPDPEFATATYSFNGTLVSKSTLAMGAWTAMTQVGTDDAGRALLVGRSIDPYGIEPGGLWVARVTSAGVLDPSFGACGVLSSEEILPGGGALAADGSVYVVGESGKLAGLAHILGGAAATAPGAACTAPTATATLPIAEPVETTTPQATTPPAPIPVAASPAAGGSGVPQGGRGHAAGVPLKPTVPSFSFPQKVLRSALAKGVVLRLVGLKPGAKVAIIVNASHTRLAKLVGVADASGTVRVRLKVSTAAFAKAGGTTITLAYGSGSGGLRATVKVG